MITQHYSESREADAKSWNWLPRWQPDFQTSLNLFNSWAPRDGRTMGSRDLSTYCSNITTTNLSFLSFLKLSSSPSFSSNFSSISSGKTYSLSSRMFCRARKCRSNSRWNLRNSSREMTRRKDPRHARKKVNEERMWKAEKRKHESIVVQLRSIYGC